MPTATSTIERLIFDHQHSPGSRGRLAAASRRGCAPRPRRLVDAADRERRRARRDAEASSARRRTTVQLRALRTGASLTKLVSRTTRGFEARSASAGISVCLDFTFQRIVDNDGVVTGDLQLLNRFRHGRQRPPACAPHSPSAPITMRRRAASPGSTTRMRSPRSSGIGRGVCLRLAGSASGSSKLEGESRADARRALETQPPAHQVSRSVARSRAPGRCRRSVAWSTHPPDRTHRRCATGWRDRCRCRCRVTSRCTRSASPSTPSDFTRSVTSPFSVNFTALPPRLTST